MERSRASSSSCPPGLRRLLFSVFPVVSSMLRSRSGESVGPPASRYRSVTGRPRRRKGASAGGVSSGPAAPPMRRAPGGAFVLATLLEEGHLEPLAQEDLQTSGYPGREAGCGEHGSPAGLDALPAPHAQLLGVHAEGLGEAAPGEAAGRSPGAGRRSPGAGSRSLRRCRARRNGPGRYCCGSSLSSSLNRSPNSVASRALSIRRRMRPEGERPELTSR